MSIETNSQETPIEYAKRATRETAKRLARFFSIRLVLQIITIIIGVYITILVANMGGYVDTILKASIIEEVNMEVSAMVSEKDIPREMREQMVRDLVEERERLAGLDQPFITRSFHHLWNGLTLNFGRARFMVSDHGSRMVRNIILERLPATLLLMGTSQLLLFFLSRLVSRWRCQDIMVVFGIS